MREYQTAQRKRLFEFLKENRDRQFTVEDIAGAVSGISTSAIYRNINQLAVEGLVRRFEREGSRKFLYQYLGGSDCASHIHLKCEKCGNMLHMDEEAAKALIKVVKSASRFRVDEGRTILFGSCESCE